MKNILHFLHSDKFKGSVIAASIFIFITAQMGNFCRFLLQLVLVRTLPPKEYSELEALLALLLILSTPILVLGPVICRYIAKYKALGEALKIKTFIINSIRNLSICGIALGICLFLFRFRLQTFLKLDTATPFLWIGIIVCLTFIYPATVNAIQGLQEFFYMGIDYSIPPMFKLIAVTVCIHAGFGINTILSCYMATAIMMVLIPTIPLRKYFKIPGHAAEKETKEIIKFAVPVIFTLQVFFILIFIDTVMVKNLFDNNAAAIYASMSMLGKIVLFLPLALFTVTLPKVSERHTLGEPTKHILINTLLFVTAVNTLLSLMYYFLPTQIISILFNGKYLEGADILVYFGIAMAFFNLSLTLIVYNIAKGIHSLLIPLAIAAIVQPSIIFLFHENIGQVIKVICLNSISLFTVNAVLMTIQTITTKTKVASR